MIFQKCIENAFGTDAEKRVPAYIQEKELSDCVDDMQRWTVLFDKCERLRQEFLLWEDGTFVGGVNGWNAFIRVCRLHLPKEPTDWAAYLYRMTTMVIISDMDDKERKSLVEDGKDSQNFLFRLSQEYYVESGYETLTREQWLNEIDELLKMSKKKYLAFPGNNLEYHKAMEANYPKFECILNYLNQNVEDCEVVRMNKLGEDVTVWYFVKSLYCVYLMYLSDCM